MNPDFTLEELLHEIAAERGVDFRGYQRSTLERRIRKRMFEVKTASYREYSEYLHAHPDEVTDLLNTVLINVTEFFRDPPAWEVLRKEMLPSLLQRRQPGETIRCWSVGCATGEEPYSIAILLAEYFGPRLSDYDVRIYATDIDEDALIVARRAEYALDRLRRVRPEWRQKYFQGDRTLRVKRDLRRLCIFGRSNVVSDAPISHVDLLVCRNLLIYFNARTQAQILQRLHYALEPHGILFIGKASSLLGAAHLFQPINTKYRIFQRADSPVLYAPPRLAVAEQPAASLEDQADLDALRLHYSTLLDTLQAGVLILDARDVVISHSEATARHWNLKSPLTGRPIQSTELGSLIPQIGLYLEQTRKNNEIATLQVSGVGDPARVMSITLKPVMNPGGARIGTLVYIEDISSRETLRTTVEELETTGQELQSANEELETTNEELQSANEELETTNEELQSANEELETTNEELQSLNEELQTANEELETRGKEVDEINRRYAETLDLMPWPVMVVGEKLRIDFWNGSAQKLFGFQSTPAAGLRLEQLPVSQTLRARLMRCRRSTLTHKLRTSLRNQPWDGPKAQSRMNIHFTPLSGEATPNSVLIMFETIGVARQGASSAKPQRNKVTPAGKPENPGRGARPARRARARSTRRRRRK